MPDPKRGGAPAAKGGPRWRGFFRGGPRHAMDEPGAHAQTAGPRGRGLVAWREREEVRPAVAGAGLPPGPKGGARGYGHAAARGELAGSRGAPPFDQYHRGARFIPGGGSGFNHPPRMAFARWLTGKRAGFGGSAGGGGLRGTRSWAGRESDVHKKTNKKNRGVSLARSRLVVGSAGFARAWDGAATGQKGGASPLGLAFLDLGASAPNIDPRAIAEGRERLRSGLVRVGFGGRGRWGWKVCRVRGGGGTRSPVRPSCLTAFKRGVVGKKGPGAGVVLFFSGGAVGPFFLGDGIESASGSPSKIPRLPRA